jgi:PAS domain-containing protein
LPKVIDLMKRREEEILSTLLSLSEKTKFFTEPKLVMIGGYALRAFIHFSRFTRDCDFALMKGDYWNIDRLKETLPEGYLVEEEQKRNNYGFLRCVKFVKHNMVNVKVSIDFMEGEIRGREANEIIEIDEAMIKNRAFVSIPIAGKPIKLPVPRYIDYFIMKVVSARASDIRDIAALICENGIPEDLNERVKQILPYPEIFLIKLKERIIPEIRRKTFLDSWRGIFGTTKYNEEYKRKVIEELEKLIKSKNDFIS